jgi:uncharacterized protein (TIGR02300 family)
MSEDGMATKAARGTKRTCQNDECETKFYDLNRDPIVCPACEQEYELAPVVEEETVPVAAVVAPTKAITPSDSADGDEISDDDDALVSLEDADAELGADDDDDADDEAFLPDDDDDDDAGVGDLIGGVEKDDDEN